MSNTQFSYSDFRTFRDELNSRESHRFTETEVKAFLLSILPQLEQLDLQHQTHSPISLDTLAFNSSQVALLQSDNIICEQLNWRKDVFALGIVAIQMLTGKSEAQLRTFDGGWNWEDECVVRDQTAQLINRMLGIHAPAFASVQEILQILKEESSSYLVGAKSLPVNLNSTSPSYSADTHVYGPHRDRRISLIHQTSKIKPKWVLLGLALGGILLGTIAIPSFNNQSQRAKETRGLTILGSILNAHTRELPENLELSPSLDELEMGIDWHDEVYRYEQILLNDAQLVVTATAKDKNLRSYSGIVFFAALDDGNIGLQSAICQTIESSKTPPQWPQLTKTAVLCPAGSVLKTNYVPSGDIYLSRGEIFDEIETHTVTSSQSVYQFDLTDFPKPVCGDPLPASHSDYPVNFHPVFVEYSDRNLSVARMRFCNDSLPVFRESKGRRYVQVSSFTNRAKSEAFADFLEEYIGSGEVGSPLTIYEPR